MAGYQPLHISGNQTGLVQNRVEFLLPNDAYPILENAFVWREKIKRRQGLQLLGRLRRSLTTVALNAYSTANGVNTIDIFAALALPSQPNAELQPGTATNPIVITLPAPIGQVLTDATGLGTLAVTGAGPILSATINYATGIVTITANAIAGPAIPTLTAYYFPSIPVMGLRLRELSGINVEDTIAFDQVYAYRYNSGWDEFLPGTTWTGSDSNFFWSTNYWIGDNNRKIFWVTNFSGQGGDPIRYTNGVGATNWVDFAPQINAAGDQLHQCMAMLPFRGRMVTFNTYEGAALGTSVQYRQRIRWAAIGNPFTVPSAIVTTVSADAWRDDIRGKGGFLDIPTSEDITAVGFVRDNLVVYCERSTWQLRYNGRSISPFQIERVNSELGTESTFSAVQFDTSLAGIGDKGVVECDSFKSDRIDIKIPDLVFEFNNASNGVDRVHGIRDFQQKLVYWIYPYAPGQGYSNKFPNRRLVYNYENDSWAIFTDSMTCLGTFQDISSLRWNSQPTQPWQQANFPWINRPAFFPNIISGNQQGFTHICGSNLTPQVSNDESLTIENITGNVTTATVVKSVNHNLQFDQIIEINNIPAGSPFNNLNGHKFAVHPTSADEFELWVYTNSTLDFNTPQLDANQTYIGGGTISVRDNFNITSKKFNFLDDGENIQMGFIDILTNSTTAGAFSLKVFLDYNNNSPVNILPQNLNPTTSLPDTFFNSVINTTKPRASGLDSTKYWQRIICPTKGAFITIQWTLSNAQLIGNEQESDVQIDSQILYIRKAGRQLPVGV